MGLLDSQSPGEKIFYALGGKHSSTKKKVDAQAKEEAKKDMKQHEENKRQGML